MPLGDNVPAQRNEEEVQENKSSRHNSVTAAVSNVQTTSQALTEEFDRSGKQATFLSRVPVLCITPFCSDALVSPPNLYPPWFALFGNSQGMVEGQHFYQATQNGARAHEMRSSLLVNHKRTIESVLDSDFTI